MGLSNCGHLTTLRLFYDYLSGETTTIGYDYSSRNAATIADLYWLSGESPKRDAVEAANGFAPPAAPPAAGLPAGWSMPERDRRRAGMVCAMLHCLAWIYNRGAPLRPYIYLIIIGRLRCPVQRPAWRWYLVSVEVLRRCEVLHRGAGGVISAFAGLVLYAVEWVKLPETHL